MTWRKSEGIVLHSTLYQSHHRILKVFTKEKGLLSFFVKNVTPNNSRLVAVTSVLSHGEWVFQKSDRELHKVKDTSLIDSFLELRNRYESLEVAGAIARLILATQMPNKPSAPLFSLLATFLKKIPEFENPKVLNYSFHFKLFMHEGMIHIHPTCSICNSPASAVISGESVCAAHAKSDALLFSAQEMQSLLSLVHAKKFSEWKKIEITSALQTKLDQVLQSAGNN